MCNKTDGPPGIMLVMYYVAKGFVIRKNNQ